MRSAERSAQHQVGSFGGWQPGIYRLIHVQEGRHTVELVESSFVADAGDSYIIHPGQLRWVTTGKGSLAQALGFIVARSQVVS